MIFISKMTKILRLHWGWDSITDITHVWLSLPLQNVVALIRVSVVASAAIITLSEEVRRIHLIKTEIFFMILHWEALHEFIPVLWGKRFRWAFSRVWRVVVLVTLQDVEACLLLLVWFKHATWDCLTEFPQGWCKILIVRLFSQTE